MCSAVKYVKYADYKFKLFSLLWGVGGGVAGWVIGYE
jgi:hypothetical protein